MTPFREDGRGPPELVTKVKPLPWYRRIERQESDYPLDYMLVPTWSAISIGTYVIGEWAAGTLFLVFVLSGVLRCFRIAPRWPEKPPEGP